MDTKQPMDKRILGDQRIFQAVVNDLKMKHELVELADGTHRYVYTYDGVDPYAMEDSEFPLTVKLIHQYGDTRELEGAAKYVEQGYGKRCATKDTDDFPELRGSVTGRCPSCEEYEHLDEWTAELKKTKEEL